MDSTVLAAIIGAGATFAGGIVVALIGRLPIEKFSSRRERERGNIPKIMRTKWEAEWYYEDDSLYVKDKVTFDEWEKGSRFSGYGEVMYDTKEYKYPIEGEISPKRIVVLTYKAEKYPTQANIGMACLELSTGAEKMDGFWAGPASKILPDGTTVHIIRTGKVKMRLIKDLRTAGE